MHTLKHQESNLSAPHTAPPQFDVLRHALFLDLDGTLVDIQDRPHAVTASAELRMLLRELDNRMSGAVALVTGRTLADADRILDTSLTNMAGVHGYELQRNGKISHDNIGLLAMRAAADDLRMLMQQRAVPALVEDKEASLALHFREAPEHAEAVRAIAVEVARRRKLRVLEGKMVVELVAGARTKGHAVVAFMSARPFKGRIPIAIGDDRTDEDAFAAAARMGGFGVLVGDVRPSAAAYALASPSAVIAWLASAL